MDTTSSRQSYLSMTGIDDLEVVKVDLAEVDASLNLLTGSVATNTGNILTNTSAIATNFGSINTLNSEMNAVETNKYDKTGGDIHGTVEIKNTTAGTETTIGDGKIITEKTSSGNLFNQLTTDTNYVSELILSESSTGGTKMYGFSCGYDGRTASGSDPSVSNQFKIRCLYNVNKNYTFSGTEASAFNTTGSKTAFSINRGDGEVGITADLVVGGNATFNAGGNSISTMASDIGANNQKVGITTQQASDIGANNQKVGITTQQASDIGTNTSTIVSNYANTVKLTGGQTINGTKSFEDDVNVSGDLVTKSSVRDDLDMVLHCGTTFSSITENKLYLKSGSDDGGATYLQYQDGPSAVEGVEFYVKDTAASPNRVAFFANDEIVLLKDTSVSGNLNVIGSIFTNFVPMCNICFGFYQRSNPNSDGLMNHGPTVDNSTANAVKFIKAPFGMKVHGISLSTDDNYDYTRSYTFQVVKRTGSTESNEGSSITFSTVGENESLSGVFSPAPVIPSGYSIGLHLNISSNSNQEVCVKLWCYQV